MSLSRKTLRGVLVFSALVAATAAMPGRADAAMMCSPGAGVDEDCSNAEAQCQASGPTCHAIGCYWSETNMAWEADCVIR